MEDNRDPVELPSLARGAFLLVAWYVVIAAGLRVGIVGSSASPATAEELILGDMRMQKAGFEVMPASSPGRGPASFGRIRRVYVSTARRYVPKVVVLHELPGLTPGDIAFGAALAQSYQVYMPVLFGTAGQDDAKLGAHQACRSDVFNCNTAGTTHPIVDDLRAMTAAICGGADCGVVGMCLTGTIPLYVAATPGVVALVMAQPTLPLLGHQWPMAGLDISEADTDTALQHARERHASIYMMRYRSDWLSGHAAFTRLADRIAPFKSTLAFYEAREVEGSGHSTLVHDIRHPLVDGEQLRAVVKALDARLRPAAPPAGS